MLTEDVRRIAREACLDPHNPFGPEFYEEHLVVVAECGARLAEPLGADAEAIELAAYLHDLSAVRDPATLATHAQASAELAREILGELDCAEPVVVTVADAIARHSEPLAIGSASPEAVCLSNADAVARMLRPEYWLYFAFTARKLSYTDGRAWLRGLFERQRAMLVEPARELVTGPNFGIS